MKYMGSKARIAKEILPIILKNRKEDQYYIEPFVGGCNSIQYVTGNVIGADINENLISFWNAIQKGWTPPSILTEQEYTHIRYNQHLYPKELVCFASIPCSYAAKEWGGYARGYTNYGRPRNYAEESVNHLKKQCKNLQHVKFIHSSYEKLSIPETSIIYCDPPYRNSTKYKHSLDYDKFYNWCRAKKAEGHSIFISEYSMPEDFRCVWKKEQVSSLTQETGSKTAIEKLFTL